MRFGRDRLGAMTLENKTMLEIINLTCGYDSKFSLKNINLKVKKGEFIGIIGPNGSGKTTLLRAITKIIKAGKGKILLRGQDIKTLSFNQIAKQVAVVSQSFGDNPQITVEELVLLGRTPYRKRWQILETKGDLEAAEEAMSLAGTTVFKNRPLAGLSAGERQLVTISAALAQKTELLLLDEPTSHLDIAHQVTILNLLKRLNRQKGLTIITILHDLNLAGEYCGRLLLLNNGVIHKFGTPQEVLTYQTIEEVYKTLVVVKTSPLSSKPYIFLVSEEEEPKKGGIENQIK